MSMLVPGHIMRWLGPAVVAAIGIAVIFEIPVSNAIMCEPEANCLLAWVGALSGWAALVGALVTVAVMREQLEEQRLQTRFQFGDSNPTIATTRFGTDYPGRIKLRLVNWNRRAIEPYDIKATLSGSPVRISTVLFTASNFDQAWSDGATQVPIRKKVVIPGWEDRSQAPPAVDVVVSTVGSDQVIGVSRSRLLRVELAVTLYGENVEQITLSTEGPIMVPDKIAAPE